MGAKQSTGMTTTTAAEAGDLGSATTNSAAAAANRGSRTMSASSISSAATTGAAGSTANVSGMRSGRSHHHHHYHHHMVLVPDGSEVADVVGTSSSSSSSSAAARQRARSLSHVPGVGGIGIPTSGATGDMNNGMMMDISGSPDSDASSTTTDDGFAITSSGLISRVFAAHSLPTQLSSFNGIRCPVCSKFVIHDDIEYHLVVCLTKPRICYNEDILREDKDECVICLDDLKQGDTIARLPCLCIYHKSCIDSWFEVNRSCPEHPLD